MTHKHVMLLEFGDGGRAWFYCSGCPAVVDVLPRALGQELKLTLVVVMPGLGGVSDEELVQLGNLWVAVFRAFAHQYGRAVAPSERQRRRRRRLV